MILSGKVSICQFQRKISVLIHKVFLLYFFYCKKYPFVSLIYIIFSRWFPVSAI